MAEFYKSWKYLLLLFITPMNVETTNKFAADNSDDEELNVCNQVPVCRLACICDQLFFLDVRLQTKNNLSFSDFTV